MVALRTRLSLHTERNPAFGPQLRFITYIPTDSDWPCGIAAISGHKEGATFPSHAGITSAYGWYEFYVLEFCNPFWYDGAQSGRTGCGRRAGARVG